MAKHYIYQRPRPDGKDALTRLELHWQAETYVMLGTGTWAGDPDHVDTALVSLPGPDAEPKDAWPGSFVELDRDQMNHLIRELRTIRNQVFGKDE
jgi:hypothetical protein